MEPRDEMYLARALSYCLTTPPFEVDRSPLAGLQHAVHTLALLAAPPSQPVPGSPALALTGVSRQPVALGLPQPP